MEGMEIRIVIMDKGFVKVCYCPKPDGHIFWLPYVNGRTIRVWGTTRGLGELTNGPTGSTVLDDTVESGMIPVRSIIDILNVKQESWEAYLQTSSDVSTPPTQPQS